jgi:hypothetical protein
MVSNQYVTDGGLVEYGTHLMTSAVPIIYCHTGNFPRYLGAVLESARFFNRDSRIYLITDVEGLRLPGLDIEICAVDQLHDDKLRLFHKNYLNISSINDRITRSYFERWFLVGELIRRNRLARSVQLDSDAMLFHDVRESFAHIDNRPCLLVGPALTYMNQDIDPFLDFINAKYADGKIMEKYRVLNREAERAGGMVNLDDQELLTAFLKECPDQISSYPHDLPIGHIDHCIFGAGDGMMSRPNRRHLASKRVFWQDDGEIFRPNFRRATDGSLVPALSIHFQNGAKRRIRRFNRVGADSSLPRSLRLRYYTWLLN